MILYILELASSHSDELYHLGCFPSDVVAGVTSAGQVIFSALCIA